MSKIKNNMTIQILFATALGILAGAVFKESILSIKLIGDIFLRLIQMSIPVLVMGQIMEAVGTLNPSELGKMGMKTIVIFLLSSLLASIFGLAFGLLFQPGRGVDYSLLSSGASTEIKELGIGETILAFFPTNIIQSMAEGSIVHIILFSLLFGVALSFTRTSMKDDPIMSFIIQLNETILKLIAFIMKIAPIGVFALISSSVARMGLQIVLPMAKYLGVYSLCTIVFLLIWFITACTYCHVGIIRLVRNIFDMSIMALVTTSSAITLPIALHDCQHKLGVGERVAKLVMPLGMPLNSNGSAMYLTITVITILQIYSIPFTVNQLVYIVVLTTLASLANAVVPGAGLIALAIVIPPLGLPVESIALFAGVDWFTGMIRTILNVDSDALTAMLVAKSENDFHKNVFTGETVRQKF